LLDPKKDGTAPAGAAGSVTKVASKKGHGVGETIVAAAKEVNPDLVGTASDAAELAGAGKEAAASGGGGGCCVIS